MGKFKQKTKSEWLQDIVHDYIAAGEPWPADRKTIAAWALRNHRWTPPKKSAIDQCAKELAEAMRAEMEKDPQGRTIRAKHCAKITEADENGNLVQKTLWFGRDAPPDLMHRALQQIRNGVLGDCKHLRASEDSYNDNNTHGAEIHLSLDFEKDLAELAHDTEYNPPPLLDDDQDED